MEAGAEEIDIVITRSHVLTGDWQALYDEVRAFREACGDAHIKTILATGELGTLRNVARASLVCMMAGADFIKTSTGKEGVNAVLPVGLVMVRAIRDYLERTGHLVGFKPAGGIRTAKDSLVWLSLMKEELGDRWLRPDLFRFGASGLLTDVERQLEHFVTGRYAAAYRLELDHFADVLDGSATPSTGPGDSLAALRLADAAELSARTGAPVQLLVEEA